MKLDVTSSSANESTSFSPFPECTGFHISCCFHHEVNEDEMEKDSIEKRSIGFKERKEG